MNVSLDLPIGKWRDLTIEELKEINRLVADSAKTHDNSE
jgi:23S rRNA pseudouridine2604 synthase